MSPSLLLPQSYFFPPSPPLYSQTLPHPGKQTPSIEQSKALALWQPQNTFFSPPPRLQFFFVSRVSVPSSPPNHISSLLCFFSPIVCVPFFVYSSPPNHISSPPSLPLCFQNGSDGPDPLLHGRRRPQPSAQSPATCGPYPFQMIVLIPNDPNQAPPKWTPLSKRGPFGGCLIRLLPFLHFFFCRKVPFEPFNSITK